MGKFKLRPNALASRVFFQNAVGNSGQHPPHFVNAELLLHNHFVEYFYFAVQGPNARLLPWRAALLFYVFAEGGGFYE